MAEKYTAAQAAAAKKYRAKFAKIELRVTKEEKQAIDYQAIRRNQSVNQYIKDCIFNNDQEHIKDNNQDIIKDYSNNIDNIKDIIIPDNISKDNINQITMYLLDKGYSDKTITDYINSISK